MSARMRVQAELNRERDCEAEPFLPTSPDPVYKARIEKRGRLHWSWAVERDGGSFGESGFAFTRSHAISAAHSYARMRDQQRQKVLRSAQRHAQLEAETHELVSL